MSATDSVTQTLTPTAAIEALGAARARTLALVEGVSDEDLERVHSPLMSPLVWDLGHIAAFEDLWLVHRVGGEPMLRPQLGALYDAFETPRAKRGDLAYLRRAAAQDYLAEVRERTLELTERNGVGDGQFHEMVIQHEFQHHETMLQTLALARLDYYRPPGQRPAPTAKASHSGLDLIELPAGTVSLGSDATGFAYDNERPRHPISLPAFRIGRTPVTNGDWLQWVHGSGYHDPQWWTSEGWALRENHGLVHPGGWEYRDAVLDHPGAKPVAGARRGGDPDRDRDAQFCEWRLGAWQPVDPQRPVVHVCLHEAQAFARAHGMRLPTEPEWEKAASWDERSGVKHRYPWGATPDPERSNLLDASLYGTAPAGSLPQGTSPCGALGMLGDVWEWTSSHFSAYPGFRAHPYPEYSEVFFGQDYNVLRGGSWASAVRVTSTSFRNWDFPDRRQIFAGVRLAADA